VIALRVGVLLVGLVPVIGACAASLDERSSLSYEPVDAGRPDCSPYAQLVRAIADEVGVDAGLIAGVATVESRWSARARSKAGARGLMQIMPSTGRRLGCGDLYAPAENLRCGARLLQRLLARYDGAVDYALAAYALGAKVPDRAYAEGSEAPRQRFIKRVMSARKAWLAQRCGS